jgi:hypothetical protein
MMSRGSLSIAAILFIKERLPIRPMLLNWILALIGDVASVLRRGILYA